MDDGLVSAVILDGSGGSPPHRLGRSEVLSPSQGTLWVHLDRRERGAVAWLGSDAGLPPVVCEALLAEETRPRTAVVDGSIIAILRASTSSSVPNPRT